MTPIKHENEDQTLSSTKTLHFLLQCNGNYWGPSRNGIIHMDIMDTVFHSGDAWDTMP